MKSRDISGVSDKETRRLLKKLRAAGACVEVTGGGHVSIKSPGGGRVISSMTSSDHRSLLNLKATIRRVMPEMKEVLK